MLIKLDNNMDLDNAPANIRRLIERLTAVSTDRVRITYRFETLGAVTTIAFYDTRATSPASDDYLARFWFSDNKFKVESRRFINQRSRNGSIMRHVKTTADEGKAFLMLQKAVAPLSAFEVFERSIVRARSALHAWSADASDRVNALAPATMGLLTTVIADMLEYRRSGEPYAKLKKRYTDEYLDAAEEVERRTRTDFPHTAVFVDEGTAYILRVWDKKAAGGMRAPMQLRIPDVPIDCVAFDLMHNDLKSKCALLKLQEGSKVMEQIGIKDGSYDIYWIWE